MKKKKVTDSSVYKRTGKYVPRSVAGETVLMPVYKSSGEINCMYSLNESASSVWKMLDGRRSVAAIWKRLTVEYRTQEKGLAQVRRLLEDLLSIGAVAEVA